MYLLLVPTMDEAGEAVGDFCKLRGVSGGDEAPPSFTLRQGIQEITRDFELKIKLKVQYSALEETMAPDL